MFINPQKALKIINSSKGRIFTCIFIKRTNGSVRRMTCRTGVKVGVTGRGLKFDPDSYNLKPVYDFGIRKFRFINLSSVIFIKSSGILYTSDSIYDSFRKRYFKIF